MAKACPGMSNYSSSVGSVQRKLERVKQRMCTLTPEPKSVGELKDLMPQFLIKTSSKFLRFGNQIGHDPDDGAFMFVSDAGLDQLVR